MSIILEALRKSENARQRQTGPGFAEVRTAARRSGIPLWVVILVGLLIVNAALMLGVFLWPDESAPPAQANNTVQTGDASTEMSPEPATLPTASQESLTTSPPVLNTQSLEATPEPPPVRSEVRSLDRIASTRETESTQTSEPTPEPVASAPAAVVETPAPPQPAAPASASGNVPSYLELRTNGTLRIADLHLDIHVYSPNRGERFVFINMRKYREGDTLTEGPVVDEITQGGVIMSHLGRRFELSRE